MYIKSGTSRGKKDVGKAKEYDFKMSKREKQIVFLDQSVWVHFTIQCL